VILLLPNWKNTFWKLVQYLTSYFTSYEEVRPTSLICAVLSFSPIPSQIKYTLVEQNCLIIPRHSIDRLKRIDHLIQQKKEHHYNSPKKLVVSETSIKKYFTIMQELGAPLYFNRRYKTYVYKEPKYFNISFIKVQ
jgi:hypothetical protein